MPTRLLDHLIRETRQISRGLLRTPVFAATVILTLALGIGGNSAIFSVVDQVLLRPLPYPEGDQLVTVYERFFGGSLSPSGERNVVSPANWLDWQRTSGTLESIAAWRPQPFTLSGVAEPVRLDGQVVSAEFFPLLRVAPLLGRALTETDDRPNAPRVVVLSYGLWQQTFGGDPSVIGRVIMLNAAPTQIVGVMPEDFRFIYSDTDLWAPLGLDRDRPWRKEAGRFLNTVARLKPGVSVDAARSDLDAIAAQLASAHEFNKETGVTVVPMREELTGQVRASLLALYAAVAVLLAIACFNVANLLLARASSRTREIAVRTSLGAGRAAILRSQIIESLLLAIAGGMLGVALAQWSVDALVAVAPADLLRVPDIVVDTRVLLYTLGVSALTGIFVAIVPALFVLRRPVAASLRTGGLTVTHAPRLRQLLVATQIALTVILLCGAGLLVRTMVALDGTDSGFNRRDLLTMEVIVSPARYQPEQRVRLYQQMLHAMRTLPGVEAAGAANSLPVIGSPRGGSWFHVRGTPELPVNDRPAALIRVVTPGYFKALAIPVRHGRDFSEADLTDTFIVNEAFVRMFMPDRDPLGAEMTVWMQQENPYMPIVGVVGDVSEGSLRDAAAPTIFYPHRRMREIQMTLFVRTPQPTALAGTAVAAIRKLDPNTPVSRVRTFEAALGESVARERLNALVAAGLALIGLIVASLGVYGLLALLVTERLKELAIRLALGAESSRLVGGVVFRGIRVIGLGALAGVVGAVMLLRPLSGLLFDVTPSDVPTYAAAVSLLCAVGTIASYLPARRAARVQPVRLLRED